MDSTLAVAHASALRLNTVVLALSGTLFPSLCSLSSLLTFFILLILSLLSFSFVSFIYRYEKQDAEIMVSWGMDYLKEDSCCGSQDHPTAFAQYGLMYISFSSHSSLILFCCLFTAYLFSYSSSPPPPPFIFLLFVTLYSIWFLLLIFE